MTTCEHGVEHGGINMCSKCDEKYTVKSLSQPANDWRSHTCGECGWAKIVPGCQAYHHNLGEKGDMFVCRHRSSDLMWPLDTKACPAFVARESATHAASIAAGKE